MVRILSAAAFALTASLAVGYTEELKSGPQAGEKVPGPFTPLNLTGDKAGEKHCLFCQNGENPVIMVFARTPECPMACKLIKEIDRVTGENKACDMGSFVVFCTDAAGSEEKIKEMAKTNGVKHCVLSLDSEAGPGKYKVSKDADITVVLYTQRTVKVNKAFGKGKITDADIAAIVADVAKIKPAK